MHSTSVLVIAYPRNSSRTNAVQCSEVQTVVVRSHRNEFDAGHVQPAVRRRRRGLQTLFLGGCGLGMTLWYAHVTLSLPPPPPPG